MGVPLGMTGRVRILATRYQLLIFIIIALALSTFRVQAEPMTVKVLRVLAGDNLLVDYQGKQEIVRLLGIDSPESRINKKAENDAKRTGKDVETIIAMGRKATAFVRTLVKPGDLVTIEFDIDPIDQYERLLGYVYLPNGKMLNEEIVNAGYANVITAPPNVKYQKRFMKAYEEARETGRGLWR